MIRDCEEELKQIPKGKSTLTTGFFTSFNTQVYKRAFPKNMKSTKKNKNKNIWILYIIEVVWYLFQKDETFSANFLCENTNNFEGGHFEYVRGIFWVFLERVDSIKDRGIIYQINFKFDMHLRVVTSRAYK